MAKILRFELPADGEWHVIEQGHATPLHVGSRRSQFVEFWGYERDDLGPREYKVLNTGDDVPDEAEYRGTTTDAGGYFIWHLIERR